MEHNISANSIYLSHFLNAETPLYGGEKVKIETGKCISNGDSCNTMRLNLPNHACTHIDFPKHFSDAGKTLNDYHPKFWFFKKPHILPVSAKQDEILRLDNDLKEVPAETDFLILKTGFQKYRNLQKYWRNNPGLHPQAASMLKAKCPGLRVIGFDFISLSSYQHREIGRAAHVEFLINNDILVVEDMNLSAAESQVLDIICLPMLINHADGVPVTIIGTISNEQA